MAIAQNEAVEIAIKALQFLAGDSEQLERFVSLSGCEPSQLRANARSPQFLAGVLEFFMGNEPTLLALCAAYSIDPDLILQAQLCLSGESNYEPGA